MKITIDTRRGKHAVSTAKKVAARGRKYKPILSCALIYVRENGAAYLRATDMETYALLRLPGATAGTPGRALIDIARFHKMLPKSGEVTVETNGAGATVMRAGRKTVDLTGAETDVNEYPVTPEIGEQIGNAALSAEVAAIMIRDVLPCAATEKARYPLEQIWFDTGDIVATDARHMAAYRGDIAAAGKPFGVSVNMLRLLSKKPGTLAICAGKSCTQILLADGSEYRARRTEGQYPAWRKALPAGNGRGIQYGRRALVDAARDMVALGHDYARFNGRRFFVDGSRDMVMVEGGNACIDVRVNARHFAGIPGDSETITLWYYGSEMPMIFLSGDRLTYLTTPCENPDEQK